MNDIDTPTPSFIDVLGLVDKGQRLTEPRLIETPVGLYLWNPIAGAFTLLPPQPAKPAVESRTVSTIESLADVALEECARKDDAMGGRGMTVIFDDQGATLYIDDCSQHLQWRFERCNSQQWQFLTRQTGQILTHKDLVRTIQVLKPSILEYPAVFSALRKVIINDKSDMVSAPVVEQGELGESYSWNMKVEGAGATKQSIPTEIKFEMPFVRGGEKNYVFAISLDIERIQKQDRFSAAFVLNFLTREVVTDTAIADEVSYFKERTATLPHLLKVLNYSGR